MAFFLCVTYLRQNRQLEMPSELLNNVHWRLWSCCGIWVKSDLGEFARFHTSACSTKNKDTSKKQRHGTSTTVTVMTVLLSVCLVCLFLACVCFLRYLLKYGWGQSSCNKRICFQSCQNNYAVCLLHLTRWLTRGWTVSTQGFALHLCWPQL